MTQPLSPYDLGDVPALVANLGPAPKPHPTIADGIHTSPATLAAALERAASDLRAMGDVTLAPTWLNLSLQVVQSRADVDRRIATVGTLNAALVGHRELDTRGGRYSTPYRHTTDRGDLVIQIYTAVGEESDQ